MNAQQRRTAIRKHWPELIEIAEELKTMGGQVKGIDAPYAKWGEMGGDGVPADVWLANSEAEKYINSRGKKGNGK